MTLRGAWVEIDPVRGAALRLEAQAGLDRVRVQLRDRVLRVLQSRANAGLPRAYAEIQYLADELALAAREAQEVLAIAARLPPPLLEIDPPDRARALTLLLDPDYDGPWPPVTA